MEDRVERIGRNEALFRQVNERLRDIGTGFSFVTESAEFVCECGDLSCAAPIRLSFTDYERIRADPTLFAIAPEHVTADLESVVERNDGWHLVRKHPGEPAEVAREEDPRS